MTNDRRGFNVALVNNGAPTMQDQIEAIAKLHLMIQDLTTTNSSADFHDVAVWNIKAALEAAYKAGQESVK